MDQTVGLRRDRPHHVFMGVACRADCDPGREIKIAVAVNVPDVAPSSAVSDQRVGWCCRGGDVTLALSEYGPSPGTWGHGTDVQRRHHLPHFQNAATHGMSAEGWFVNRRLLLQCTAELT
jgi:hypothetical protein